MQVFLPKNSKIGLGKNENTRRLFNIRAYCLLCLKRSSAGYHILFTTKRYHKLKKVIWFVVKGDIYKIDVNRQFNSEDFSLSSVLKHLCDCMVHKFMMFIHMQVKAIALSICITIKTVFSSINKYFSNAYSLL